MAEPNLLDIMQAARERERQRKQAPPSPAPLSNNSSDLLNLMRSAKAQSGTQDPSALPPINGLVPPDPVSAALATAGFQAPPPHMDTSEINLRSDPFYKTATDLFHKRGLDIPNDAFGNPAEVNKWIRDYTLKLESDPATRDALEAVSADPLKQGVMGPEIVQGYKLLYAIQKAPGGTQETHAAFADALRTWHGSTHVDREGKPVKKPASLPPDYNYTQAADLMLRSQFHKGTANFTPEEKATYDAMGGRDFTLFWNAHRPYFLARQRMERLVGLPVDRETPQTIAADQARDQFARGGLPNRPPEGFTERMMEKAGLGLTYQSPTTVPTEATFHLADLAPLSGPLGELGKDILARRQAPPDPNEPKDAPWTLALPASTYLNTGSPALAVTTPEAIRGTLAGVGRVGDTLNLLTLGVFYGVWNDLNRAAEAIGEGSALIFSSDHDTRRYQSTFQAFPMRLYRAFMAGFDPKGTEALVKHDAFWRDMFPTGDPAFEDLNSDQRLNGPRYTEMAIKRWLDRGTVDTSLATVLGLNTADARATLGNLLSAPFHDSSNLILMALGSHTLFRATRGFGKLPLVQKFSRFTKLDEKLAAMGLFSEAAAGPRAPLLDFIERELGHIKRPRDVAPLLHRLEDELKSDRGPLDPAITAATLAEFQSQAEKLKSLEGRRLSGPARQALASLAPVVDSLGNPMDVYYVIKGENAVIGPRWSAQQAQNLRELTAKMEEIPNTPVPRLLKTLFPKEIVRITTALADKFRAIETFNARRNALFQLLDDLGPELSHNLTLRRVQLDTMRSQMDAGRVAHNTGLLQALERFKNLELNGGERLRPNPAQYKEVFTTLTDWLGRGLFKAPALTRNAAGKAIGPITGLFSEFAKAKGGALFEILAGSESAALKKALKAGDPAAYSRLGDLAQEWLNRNSRPEVEFVPPRPNPRTGQITRLEEKLKNAADSESPLIELTASEAALLSETSEIPLKPGYPATLKALEDTYASARGDLGRYQRMFNDLHKTREFYESADPLKPDRLGKNLPKAHALFLDALEKHFQSPEWLVRGKGYVNLYEPLAPGTLSALDTLKTIREGFSKDAELLFQGLTKFEGIDYAIMAASDPARLFWSMNTTRRLAEGLKNEYRFTAEKIVKTLQRDLSPADMQQLLVDIRNNNLQNPDAAIMIQRARMDWLHNAYRVGLISRDKFLEFSGNTHYYHGAFSREELRELPPPQFQRPPRFSDLRVSPYEFSFKIPEDSWYVAWQDGRKIKHHSGFPSQEAAQAWLERQAFKEGTEVAVHPPFRFEEKEMAGLVVDAGSSTLDLADRMGVNQANFMTARMISQTPFVRTPQQFLDLEPQSFTPDAAVIKDKGGVEWYQMRDPRVPMLQGKYVSEQVISWLHHTNASYGWYQELARGMQEGLGWRSRVGKLWKNPLIPLEHRLANTLFSASAVPGSHAGLIEHAATAMGGALGMFGVGINLAMLPTQAISNLALNMPMAGFNPLTPYGWLKTIKYGWEGAQSLRKWEDDPIWNALARNGNIEHSGLRFSAFQEKTFQRNWASLEGLNARIERNAEAIDRASTSGDDALKEALQGERARLKNEASTLAKASARGWAKELAEGSAELFTAAAKTAVGKGPVADFVYKSVGITDDMAKYITLKFLVHDRGMTLEEALPYIDGAMQNLQSVPEPVRLLAQAATGSKFTTYPWNQARNFAWFLTHRPLAFSKYLGTIAAWNWGMAYANRKNPEEELAAHAMQEGYQTPSWVSSLGWTFGRLQLPYGGALSMEPVWGLLYGQSRFGRAATEVLSPQMNADSGAMAHLWKKGVDAAIGLGSKFTFGSPILNWFTTVQTGRDMHGNPVSGPWEVLGSTLKDTVSIARDVGEVYNWATTEYRDVRTGEKKSLADHFLRRLFKKIPESEFSDAALLRAVASAHLSNNPQKVKVLNQTPYNDRLKNRIFAGGGVRDDGTTDWDKARPIVEDFLKEVQVGRTYFGPEGLMRDTPPTDEEKDDMIQKASIPDQISAFKALTLGEQLSIYAKLNQIRPTLSHSLKTILHEEIDTKIQNGHPELEGLIKTDLPLVQAWSTTPTVPEAVRAEIADWYRRASAYAKAARANSILPGTVPNMRPRLPGRPAPPPRAAPTPNPATTPGP